MPAPYDYSAILRGGQGLVPNYADDQARRQELDQRSQLLDMQKQRQAMEIEEQRRAVAEAEQYKGDVATALLAGDPKSISDLILKHPKKAEQIKAAWDLKDKAAQAADLRQSSEVYSALKNGRYDLAAQSLRTRIDADKAAGDIDPVDQAMLVEIESGDPARQKAAMGMIGYQLAAITGGNHMSGTLSAIEGDSAKPFTLGAGETRYGPDGKIIVSSPYKPQIIRDAAGNPYEYTPGSGVGGGLNADSVFEAMIAQESGGKQFTASGEVVTSPKGAIGIAQIMPGTLPEAAALAGLPADMRRLRTDPDYGRTVGRAYYEKQLENFGGDPALAAAAYNAGPKRVRAALEKGGPDGWISYVPKETQGYVAAVTKAAPGGGPNVRALTPNVQKPQYRLLTPEETTAQGLDPNVKFQMSPDGQITPVGGQNRPNLKPWPVNALNARTDINAALTNIMDTLKVLSPKNNSAEARAARAAIGPGTGALGEAFTQWNNPEGTPFRSRIGQIGGIIIKDTSGAAVSLSEDARLAKWVPLVTDTPKAARDKLSNLARELKLRSSAMDQSFSEEQGYRPFSSAPSASGEVITVKTVQEAQKLTPGTLYRAPDGKVRRR